MNILLISLLLVNTASLEYRFRNEYRQEAIDTIQNHLAKHPKCELQHLIPIIQDMSIYFEKDKSFKYKAIALRENETDRVFINANIHWNKREAIVTLIHEATHLGDSYLCGNDLIENVGKPVCNLFGEIQYKSQEITNVIREHLNL